jgi:hypothetical protein
MPHDPNEQGRENRRTEDGAERRLREITACRSFGEVTRDEFEMLFDQSEVGSHLIRLSQCERVFVWCRTLCQ